MADNKKEIGAFFDFDRTLLTTETAKLFIKYIIKKKKLHWGGKRLSLIYFLRLIILNFFYIRHLVSDMRMAILLFKFYKGRKKQILEDWAPEFYYKFIKPEIAPNILQRLNDHKQKKHQLILVSAGLKSILKHVQADLGFDYLICSDLEVDENGLYTGRTAGPICIESNKKELATELANKLNLNLKNSYSYGNHEADIPILEMAGNSFAVEPTEPLRKVAQLRGWPVLSFK